MNRAGAVAAFIATLLWAPDALAQSAPGMGFGGGQGNSSRLGSGGSGGGSFRPNNSTFGSPLSLNTGPGINQTATASANFTATDPFQRGGFDPLAQGRAGGGAQAQFPSQRQGRGNGAGARLNRQLSRSPFTNQATPFQQQQQSQRRVRTVTRIAFVPVPVEREAAIDSASLALTPQTLPGARNLNVRFEGGVHVLRGTVASEHDSRLAAAMLALEPGVRNVRNELVVAPAEPETPVLRRGTP